MTTFNEDQGTAFGTWGDAVSRFMYEDSLRAILPIVKLTGHVGDFGGANGLLKKFHENTTTIDTDATKQPDIVDDILTHDGVYDVAWCRYVLHYLTDQQVIQFIDNVKASKLVIVQFVNDDLRGKYANSYGETKFFRTTSQLEALLPDRNVKLVFSETYVVDAAFYLNRLGFLGGKPHKEKLNVYEVYK